MEAHSTKGMHECPLSPSNVDGSLQHATHDVVQLKLLSVVNKPRRVSNQQPYFD
jgi:hypothetical protein